VRIIAAERISEAAARLYIKASRELPADVRESLRAACARETWPPARDILDQLIANFELAQARRLPLCQDTGAACVFLEIGGDAHIEGDIQAAVDEGIRRAQRDGFLRASMVADPLRRVNTGDNTPAMLCVDFTGGDRLVLTVAPKGFGSENMSRIAMLSPSDGVEGVISFVLETVEAAGPNPCPPVVAGIGIGGAFDKAALLAKKAALLRPLGGRHPDPYYAELEAELERRINALGIGPQGFGGAVTALAVMIETMPTHIAGLPCAVSLNCHAVRRASEVI
jgi:fumarate hydratase subunit alpha